MISKKQEILEFNKTNNISMNINPKKFEIVKEADTQKKILALSIKSRNIWKDIIIRFFKNKWNTFFVVLILLLIITVYIGKYMTGFSNINPVSKAGTKGIAGMKPSWISGWNQVEEAISNTDLKQGLVPWYDDSLPGSDKIEASYNAYVISKSQIKDSTGVWKGDYLVVYKNRHAISTLLGTDMVGNDVLTRLLYSAAWSLNLALIVAVVETIIGVAVGIYLGYHVGKTADTIFMRFVEFFGSIPPLLWMFVFALIIGTSFWAMVLVLITVGWVGPVWAARIFSMKIKDHEFILAAKAGGASEKRILFSHILPNIVGRLLVSFFRRMTSVIFFETTLVFLGFRVGGDERNSIGNIIQSARTLDMIKQNVSFIISITFFLVILSVSTQIIANGVRDAFDPRLVK